MAGPDELEKYHNLYRVNIDKIWKGKQKNGKKPKLTKLNVFSMIEKDAMGKSGKK
jgi:hypothetical protein